MINLIPKIFFYNLFYYFGWPKIGPFNITLGLTYNCNSRCQTCNIWRKTPVRELNLDEHKKIFKSIGRFPYEIILTGGEPFLKKEIVSICGLIDKYLKPKAIIIPTNGLLSEIIPKRVEEILKSLPKTDIVVNLSLDGFGPLHDKIRGIPGNFDKALKTYNALRSLKAGNKNLDFKIHTVISKFNVKEIPQIYRYIRDELGSPPFITEIAEERVELNTLGSMISPLTADYIRVVDFLISEIKKEKFSGLDRVIQAFRIEYYNLVKKILLNKKRALPCFAAITSVQITPDGYVWACCIKGESMGDLRRANYDFNKIWQSQRAKSIRKAIKERKCFCPLANASYTNMLCHLPTLLKVGLRLLTNL
ncbi:MAG: hypothetical protein A3A94_03545 [Candidatus Portnoybacteria bacterium RIFCSPLOWO2_01_FULL_43_11]|uniref:Radical SAM core domain-containing protein n=4 Tax=Bacteria candidate phyla TaxID=1783234 RepID=A0A1G2FTF4_9BACT|nr:MAG: hypothetical protein A2713_01880 [candidate division WWE3 bacterium RIFCSPHIGHO2_01_FULL_35_17]OGZ37904.1 MAG: hypothetical protein A3E90_01530 [Candidatus Portnoybacteria bacterium RIFCSPHIGHO2_12_FULL_40_11]OGZ38424.1 MAG: hypothetical protein A3A94_03545 [Candidatus Portnoybacteria bacterium RIFCSPLOWO2_01_FULL_43_11]OGZ40821.1 MAG: hypothetical protein A3I20_02350 [Candidatus Portnoybacteria bacterium RIFCSPLOWO2_02_FULL_40_15]